MTNDQRITALAQSIYQARHNEQNDATDTDLTAFLDQTIEWVNQLTPEIQTAKDSSGHAVDWNQVRIQNNTIGTVTNGTTISYALPSTIRKLVINTNRDLTIQQGGIIVSTFKLVNANQMYNPDYPSTSSLATVIGRNLIFSRPLTVQELNGTIVADTINYFPQLSHTDVSLLDILDADLDFRQLYVLGVLKNQILPDIVQGGLTPSFSGKFDTLLTNLIAANNESADADDAYHENMAWIRGVGF